MKSFVSVEMCPVCRGRQNESPHNWGGVMPRPLNHGNGGRHRANISLLRTIPVRFRQCFISQILLCWSVCLDNGSEQWVMHTTFWPCGSGRRSPGLYSRGAPFEFRPLRRSCTSEWGLSCSGILCEVGQYVFTDVLGQHMIPIFRTQALEVPWNWGPFVFLKLRYRS